MNMKTGRGIAPMMGKKTEKPIPGFLRWGVVIYC